MANPTLSAPALLTDPGYLYWAPLGSAVPTHVSTASVFSDTWPVAWIPLGMTDSGTDIDLSVTASPIIAAEVVYPLTYRTTASEGTVTFALKAFTATLLSRALNGAVLSVTGAGATLITTINPPAVGSEVRSMIGFESLDSTFRWIGYQVFSQGSTKLTFNKAPASTLIPWTLKLEKPVSTQPWTAWTAGASRA